MEATLVAAVVSISPIPQQRPTSHVDKGLSHHCPLAIVPEGPK